MKLQCRVLKDILNFCVTFHRLLDTNFQNVVILKMQVKVIKYKIRKDIKIY